MIYLYIWRRTFKNIKMKKILLSLAVAFTGVTAFSQSVIFFDDFDDLDISNWTLVDADGDGNNWSAVQIQNQDGSPVGTPVLRSSSWNGNPLFPDNWAISPALDLSSFSSGDAIALNWEVMAIDADWDVENYTVYVAAGNSIDDLAASTVTFNESTLDGINELTPRTLDISSFAGQSAVYFAFRHHNVSDQFTIEIDNVVVEGSTMSVTDASQSRKVTSVYPNPAVDAVNINLSNQFNADRTTVSVLNMSGKLVAQFSSVDAVNVKALPKGVYVLEFTDGKHKETKKLIKK